MNNEEAEKILQTYQPEESQGSDVRIRKILSRTNRQTGSRDIFLFLFVNLWTACALMIGTLLNDMASNKSSKPK